MDLSLFRSLAGRISGESFWLGLLVLLIISWIVQVIFFSVFGVSVLGDPNATPEQAAAERGNMALPLGIVILFTLWPSLALYTKRWHDRGKSGWW